MAEIRAGKDIEQFVRAVTDEYAPDEIILFGSRARGDHWTPSDYDFIVVSRRFAGVNWHDRIVSLLTLWDRPEAVDILPYTPEEFARKKSELGIVRVAVREGQRLIN
jgi:uncharacterized protein